MGDVMLHGVIERFDAADGLGDIRLRDGTIVRFGITSLKDFRGAAPEVGMRVVVAGTKPGFKGVVRATEVRLVEEAWDKTWYVHGIDAQRIVDDEISGKRVRLLPYDPGAFVRLGELRIDPEMVARRSFGAPHPTPRPVLHPVLASLPALEAHARLVLRMMRAPGEPSLGSTFVGDGIADLGEGEWPSDDGTALRHVLQIGEAEARAIGLDQQINVFTGAPGRLVSRTPVIEAMGAANLFAAVPGDESPFIVVASRGGSRRTAPGDVAVPPIALTRAATAVVYPDPNFLQSTDPAVQSLKGALFDTYVVDATGRRELAPDLRVTSAVQCLSHAYPGTESVDGDVVLGGLSSPLGRAAPRARLASIDLQTFPDLRAVLAHGDEWIAGTDDDFVWHRWAIDWSPDASPPAWAYGR